MKKAMLYLFHRWRTDAKRLRHLSKVILLMIEDLNLGPGPKLSLEFGPRWLDLEAMFSVRHKKAERSTLHKSFDLGQLKGSEFNQFLWLRNFSIDFNQDCYVSYCCYTYNVITMTFYMGHWVNYAFLLFLQCQLIYILLPSTRFCH